MGLSTYFSDQLNPDIFFYQLPPAVPSPCLLNQPPRRPVCWFVVSVATQGDVWLFAECKDNHWAINGNQKGTISKVLTCDTCLVCVSSEEENPGEEKKTNLEFKLLHAKRHKVHWSLRHVFLAVWLFICWIRAAAEVCVCCLQLLHCFDLLFVPHVGLWNWNALYSRSEAEFIATLRCHFYSLAYCNLVEVSTISSVTSLFCLEVA